MNTYRRLRKSLNILPDDKDLDLDRIVRLIEIIKRYEILTEYILSGPLLLEDEGISEYLNRIKKEVIQRKLIEHRGNLRGVAIDLKVDRESIYRYMRTLNIDRNMAND